MRRYSPSGPASNTGIRVGQAIRLDRADLDTTEGLLVVRNSKFGKAREVPLHPTTVAVPDLELATQML